MSGYIFLLLQLGLCLLAALFLGALLGYLLWRWLGGRRWAAETREWKDQIRLADDKLAVLRGELEQNRNDNERLVADVDGLTSEVSDWLVRSESKEAERISVESDWQAKYDGVHGDLTSTRKGLAELTETADERLARVSSLEEKVADQTRMAAERSREIEALEARLSAASKFEGEARSLQGQVSSLTGDLKLLRPFKAKTSELEVRLEQLEAEGREKERQDAESADRLQKTREEEKEQLAALERKLTDSQEERSRVVELEREIEELAGHRTRVAELEQQLAAIPPRPSEGEIRSLRLELERQKEDIREARREANERAATASQLQVRLEALKHERREQAVTPSALSDELEAPRGASAVRRRPAPAPEARNVAEGQVTEGVGKRPTKDNLKAIHGIGPKLERVLNQNGVHSFRQVALWKSTDIEKFGTIFEKKGWFAGRIERDRWLDGARDEHFKKYGNRLSPSDPR